MICLFKSPPAAPPLFDSLHARVVSPRILDPYATAFDTTVTQTASTKLGLPSSLNNVALIPLSLPIRLGGFGLRSVRMVSPAAYYASLARAAPYILKLVPNPDRRES